MTTAPIIIAVRGMRWLKLHSILQFTKEPVFRTKRLDLSGQADIGGKKKKN